MIDNDEEGSIATFTPALRIDDEYLSFWLQNVTVRLRREICWNLRERSLLMDPETHGLEPSANLFVSKGLLDLNQVKYWREKQKFFQSDVTAKYLTDLLQSKIPRGSKIVYGSFHWLVKQLNLDDVSIFVISLLLACHLDS